MTTTANNIMDQDAPLTPEDRFLLELLVDGELEEPQRRDLLLKLDRIPEGWRCCAIAFLESQCLKDSCRADAAEHEVETVAVSVKTIPDPPDGPKTAPSPTAPRSAQAERAAFTAERGDDAFVGEEPVILPLDRSGLSRRMWHTLEHQSAGLSRRGFVGAVACGFLLAILTTGMLGSLFWAYSTSPSPRMNIAVSDKIPAAAPSAPEDSASGEAMLAQNDPAPIRPLGTRSMKKSVSALTNVAAPIQHVTLKSPSNDLDGISVPCVESDRYDPSTLRRDDTSDRYVETLRKNGHKVETRYDDLMFPLDDGRMLIVPVDTINVRYKNSPQQVIYQ